ncbi:MAG: hypothetical protein M3R36_03240 [Bacteroidota bacterium]|nr:hypothetical protein [Bacteroidota bacterium]
MKILFFLLISLILIPEYSFSQQPVIDSLQKQINEIKKTQDRDFEKKVEEAVKKETFDYVSKIWGITAIVFSVVIAIAGFLGYKFTGSWIKDLKDKIDKSVITEIDDKVSNTIKTDYNKITQRQNTFFMEIKLDRLKLKYDDETKNFSLREVNQDFLTLMEDCAATDNKEFTEKTLSEVIKFLFDKRFYFTITELANKYEKSYEINETDWANVAISNMSMYVFYGSKQYKEMAIKSSNNSLNALPNYGEPQAVKLIIYAFDISKKPIQSSEEKTEDIIKTIFEELNSGTDFTSAYEACNYILRLGDTYSEYKNILIEKFPGEFKDLESRKNIYRDLINPPVNTPFEQTDPNADEKK